MPTVDPAKVRHYEPEVVVRVDGSATVWAGPQEPVRPDTSTPEAAERLDVPDRVDARYRLDDSTLDDVAGTALHKLWGRGEISGEDLPRLADRFRDFLREHAREVANGGDGVRFPLSAWVKDEVKT